MNTLEVKGLEKKYKDFTLENITLELPKGFICGYVGQNGAGKTTTLDLITHQKKSGCRCSENRRYGI
jgi:ABC-2 type transport system ATP-binding protein